MDSQLLSLQIKFVFLKNMLYSARSYTLNAWIAGWKSMAYIIQKMKFDDYIDSFKP